ncbi:MAG: hypothetical protein KGN32_00295 [Burkholderiales bacterium]|nr:hypothetical protein [Burkholderiales bacterium]
MNLPVIQPHTDDFIDDAAQYACENLGLDALAAKHRISASAALARISDPETLKAVEARAVTLGQSGAAARAQSHGLLRKCLKQLDSQLETGQLGAVTLVRIAEFVHKVTGMAPMERAPVAENKEKFSVHIILSNSPGGTPVDVMDVVSREVRDE